MRFIFLIGSSAQNSEWMKAFSGIRKIPQMEINCVTHFLRTFFMLYILLVPHCLHTAAARCVFNITTWSVIATFYFILCCRECLFIAAHKIHIKMHFYMVLMVVSGAKWKTIRQSNKFSAGDHWFLTSRRRGALS